MGKEFEMKIKQFNNAKKLVMKDKNKLSDFDRAICKTLRPILLEQPEVDHNSLWTNKKGAEMFQFHIGFDKDTIAQCVFADDEYEAIALLIGEFASSRLTIRYEQTTKHHHTTYFDDVNSVLVPHSKAVRDKMTEALEAFPILGRIRNLSGIVENWVFMGRYRYGYRFDSPDLLGRCWPLKISFEERFSISGCKFTVEYFAQSSKVAGWSAWI